MEYYEWNVHFTVGNQKMLSIQRYRKKLHISNKKMMKLEHFHKEYCLIFVGHWDENLDYKSLFFFLLKSFKRFQIYCYLEGQAFLAFAKKIIIIKNVKVLGCNIKIK